MRLLSAKYHNLFSIDTAEVILAERGLVLITGYSHDENGGNGSGKSSISSKGIIWTLFGSTTSGARADKVINRHGDSKKAWGEVTFEGHDGATYTVRRERPSKLILLRDGSDISTKHNTQQLIDQAIGMDFITFVQTAFFGQGRSLSYLELPPEKQKYLLEQILPMDDISNWTHTAFSTQKELEEEVTSHDYKLMRAKDILDSAQEHLVRVKGRSSLWERERQAKLSKLKSDRLKIVQQLEPMIDIEKEMTADIESVDVSALEAQQVELNLKINELDKQIKALQKEIIGEGKDLSILTTNIASLKGERAAKLSKENKCGTCGREFDKETLNHISEEIAFLDLKIGSSLERVNNTSSYIDRMNCESERLTGERDQLTHTYKEIGRTIMTHSTSEHMVKGIRLQIEAGTAKVDAELEATKNTVNPHTDTIPEMEKKLKKAEESYVHTETENVRLSKELAHVSYWKNVYNKAIRLRLFEASCAYLEKRTEIHLRGLQNSQFKVKFNTSKKLSNGKEKAEFNVTVSSGTGGDDFSLLSGGEQQMVSFAVGLALADLAAGKTITRPAFMILDEPFSQLDPKNAEAVVDYLTGDFGRSKDTILLVSNEQALQQLIPERIHVEKQGGLTFIK